MMNLRNRFTTFMTFGAIFGLSIGCRSDPTGGTKTKEKNKENLVVPKDTSFSFGNLKRVELKQGGTKEIEVLINRGADFKSEVKVSMRPTTQGIKGITFSPADWMLRSDENSKTVIAKADPTATVGTFSWRLIARPRVGSEVIQALQVVVSPNN